MSGAIFVLGINGMVAGLLMGIFLRLASYEPLRKSASYFAAAYGLGLIFFAIEFAIPLIDGDLVAVNAAYAAFVAALALFNGGLGQHYRVRFSWPMIAGIVIASMALKLASDGLPRDSLARLLLYQLPFAVMQLIGVVIVLRSRRRTFIDAALVFVLSLSALHFIAKPVIAVGSGGVGQSPATYSGTLYALISQSAGAVLGVATAALVVVMLIRDLMAHADLRSDTDELSGLLNRRGFMKKGDMLLDRRRNRLPLSLVVCDLDYFKSVNDRFGHATGDELIASFGEILRGLVRGADLAGRIGGEEFAVLLSGCDIVEARTFAERVRLAVPEIRLMGIPEEIRSTVSIGIAQQQPGETLSDLFARADAGLYVAKRSGRNRVSAAPPQDAVAPGQAGMRRA